MVRAQVDDLFGDANDAHSVDPKSDTSPTSPTPVDDLFGTPVLSRKSNQNAPAPTPAAENDFFGPATPAPAPAPDPTGPDHTTMQRVPGEPNDQLCKCEGDTNLAAISKIERALSTPLSRSGLDFADTPLEEVINFLQDQYEIPMQIDSAALDEHGISVDEPVTISLRNVSLRSALRLMLKQLQLTAVVDNEVLVITTSEDADTRIKVCVYDVRDLIDGQAQIALSELTDVITSCVSPESWAESRRGSIRSYPPNLLVIAQPQRVHEQIQGLLKRMRQMRQRPSAPAKAAPTPVTTR
jgi:hypothetical protein